MLQAWYTNFRCNGGWNCASELLVKQHRGLNRLLDFYVPLKSVHGPSKVYRSSTTSNKENAMRDSICL